MYYITNENNQIIAVSPDLLELLKVKSIDKLYRKIALGDIEFSLSKKKINITMPKNTISYVAHEHKLLGILGKINLIEIEIPSTSSKEEVEDKASESQGFVPEDLDTTSENNLISHQDSSNMHEETLTVLGDMAEKISEQEAEEESFSLVDESIAEEDAPSVLSDIIDEVSEKTEEEEESLSLVDNEPISTDDKNITKEGTLSILDDIIDKASKKNDDILSLLKNDPIIIDDKQKKDEETLSAPNDISEEEKDEEEDTFFLLNDEPLTLDDKQDEELLSVPNDDISKEEEEEDALFLLNDEPLTLDDKQDEELLSVPNDDISKDEEEEDALFLLDDDPLTLDDKQDEELLSIPNDDISKEEKEEDEISLLLDDSLDIEKSIETEEKDNLLDLIKPHSSEETIDEVLITDTPDTIAQIDDNTPIYINIEEISQHIGISAKDYDTFLNEYIDTALSLEKDLQSDQEDKRFHAVGTLLHLSNVLHLPVICDIITKIKNTPLENQDQNIELFYASLAKITTSPPLTEEPKTEVNIKVEKAEVVETPVISDVEPEKESIEIFTIDEENIDSLDAEDEEEISLDKEDFVHLSTPEPIQEAPEATGFGTIDLNDVEPVYFDFRLEDAANELSLPVELIEEFVHDFVDQGNTETVKMLEAYKKGDLKTIQAIGHLLKGASSNLRINPLADTLYDIQFCEDSSKMEALIKRYWAHFISFEKQLNLTSN